MTEIPQLLRRFVTGVPGVDTVLCGGLPEGGIYIASARPGAGKTLFANQICFAHAKRGGRAVYVTLLAETHSRMLSQLWPMSFFDPAAVGDSIRYLNGYGPLEASGLTGLLQLVRGIVREHKADFLVIDGMLAAEELSKSDHDLKKFINELQSWVGVVGCTVLILNSGPPNDAQQQAHTLVDGIFELSFQPANARIVRQFAVTKLRGSAFVEGVHHYDISKDGLRVYPRIEAAITLETPAERGARRVPSGVETFDPLIAGGYAFRSTTLLLGPSGSGKTLWGMHFLSEGIRRGEPGLHFGFFENPQTLRRTARNLGLRYDEGFNKGLLRIVWHKMAEQALDQLGYEILEDVEKRGVKRLFIDGLVGFKEAMYPTRIGPFMAILTEELARRDVTTLISEETRELFVRNVEIPTSGASASFENIVFLRLTDASPNLGRMVSVMKTRDANHSKVTHAFEMRDADGIVVSEASAQVGDLRTALAAGPASPQVRQKKKKKKLSRRSRG